MSQMDIESDINSLPEEMLINIFGYLSPKMLKSCCLVSKSWNQTIKASNIFKDKFCLTLNGWKEFDEYKNGKFSRNFNLMMINEQDLCSHGCMLQGLKDVVNPNTLNSLELGNFEMKLSELVELLNYLTELEVFGLNNVTLDVFPRAFIKKAKVKKLKKLDLHGKSFILDNFLKTLDVDTLKEFSIEFSSDQNYTDIKQWIKFLGEQKELENLTMGPSSTSLLFQYPEIFNFKFPLTRFNMPGNSIFQHLNAFFRFLIIHARTLEKLILRCMPSEYDFTIYEFIWSELPVIKHIDFNAAQLFRFDWILAAHPDLLPKYKEKMPSIESVDFLGVFDEWDINKQFFKMMFTKYSNAKSIDLSKININIYWTKIIRQIGKEMKNLTVLRMPLHFEQKVLKNIHFPKLTEFSIFKIEDVERVRSFIRRHSHTLEKVTFRWSDIELIGTVIDEIRYCENHKLITIQAKPKEAARLFNVLRRRARGRKSWNLRVEIREEHVDYIFNYKFPDDIAYWNAHNNWWSLGLAKESWNMSAVADKTIVLDLLSNLRLTDDY